MIIEKNEENFTYCLCYLFFPNSKDIRDMNDENYCVYCCSCKLALPICTRKLIFASVFCRLFSNHEEFKL